MGILKNYIYIYIYIFFFNHILHSCIWHMLLFKATYAAFKVNFFQAYKQWAHIDIGMSPIMFTIECISMKYLVILVQTFNLGFNYYFL